MLNDPALGSEPLLTNQFQEHKRLSEELWRLEAYPLPTVLRFNPDDMYMTALCSHLIRQAQIPIEPPLVATFSTEYYWTQPDYNLIFVPTLERDSLLGLPDLYHEIGHLLIAKYRDDFIKPFLKELLKYIIREKLRVQTEQRPRDSKDYDLLLVQWQDRWVVEFAADMILEEVPR